MALLVTQGIYKHYKSTHKSPRLYQVLFLSHQESNLEVLVHYQPLYYDEVEVYNDGITIWTRTLENFCSEVNWQGEIMPRFKRVS